MLNLNNELNGIEIIFDNKPATATLEALKSAGFRWHKVKKLWYAKNTPERLELAQSITGGEAITAQPQKKAINLDNLGQNAPHLYGAELAKAIREELKARGVDGVTVRKRDGYTTSIYVTVKATAGDFSSIEEAKERFTRGAFTIELERSLYINNRYYNFVDYEAMTEEEKEALYTDYIKCSIKKLSGVNVYHMNRANYWELTTAFYNKIYSIYLIANQWNYDNSDLMTDYHDVGYYLDIDIKAENLEPREAMTDEERAALIEEREEEARQNAEALRKYEEQRKQDEERAAKYKAWEEEATAKIYNNIVVEDLETALYITELAGGIGKEASKSELLETIEEYHNPTQDARVTRKVIFTDSEALEAFNMLYLNDFDFIAGKGGTASEDARLNNPDIYNNLTTEQRETIKFYNNDCIAVYYGDTLQIVINPEGFTYSRYVYVPTDATEIKDAAEELRKQEEESKAKPGFYIPAPVEEQAEAIKPGEAVTIYQCDGWILNNIYAGAGIVEAVTPGTYAQYKGVYITLTNGRKSRRVFIRNNNDCLIYSGILDKLPESITGRQISPNMREMYNYNILLPNAYNYYKSIGKLPILDTLAR